MNTEVEQKVAKEAKGEGVGLCLCHQWWVGGDGALVWKRYTMAERAAGLMESAREWLAEGHGVRARLVANAGRYFLRTYFPSAQRRARAEAMEQPCPAVVVTGAGALEAEYEELYLAHFVAGGAGGGVRFSINTEYLYL